MKKVLVVILGLLALMLAAIVVLPGFVDWNDYKNAIQTELKGLTGRNVVIGGDIHITVLPTPAVVANNVRIANIKGASAADMVRLKSLQVRIALGPLLTGDIQVETVRLVDPIIELERLADGRVNWEFTPIRTGADGSASVPLPGGSGGPFPGTGEGTAIRLDSFQIENGTIVYRDASGSSERVEHLQARLSADSLSGPLDSVGKFDFRGIALGYELALGKIINDRTVPLNMALTTPAGESKLEVSGAIVELADAPKFKGKVTASGKRLSELLQAVGGSKSESPLLAQSFSVGGDVVVSAKDLSVKSLSTALGGMRADGELTAGFGAAPATFALKLTTPRIDVDALLAVPEDQAAAPASRTTAKSPSVPVPDKTGAEPAAPDGGGFSLPGAVHGTVELSAATVTYRGGIISDARLDAELNAGELTVSQFSAQLPGGSDLFAVGVLSADKGKPKFDGNVDARVSDLRRVMAWLGIPAPDVASDRLRKATFKGRIVADTAQIQGLNLDMVVDSSHINGGVTVALRSRPAFGASILVDRLNLDAYLASEGGGEDAAAANPTVHGDAKAGTGGKAAEGSAESFAFLRGLNLFDANLRLQVERMTYRQVPISGFTFDGTLFTGNLDIRKLSVGDLAGASATFSGSLDGLDGLPSLKGGHIDIRGVDIDRLARQFEISAPVATRSIGVMALTGGIEGSILRPHVDVVVKAPEASVDLKGRLSVIPVETLFAGDIKVHHADLQRLFRIAGIDYRPSGRLGGFDLAAAVKADPKQVALSQMTGKVGPVSLDGTLAIDLAGARPRISGDVKTGRIVIDPFLPPRRTAALMDGVDPTVGQPRIIPAAWSPAAIPSAGSARPWLVAATGGGRWPTDPLDLTALGTFDADLKLASEAVVYDGITFNGVTTEATVADGALHLGSLSATLFGGALNGDAVLRSLPTPALKGTVSLSGADFGVAEQEIRGKRLASGAIAFKADIDTTGRSVAEMMSGLKGDGSFEVRKVALGADSGKSSLGPISGLISALNEIAGALAGGQRPEGLADVTGSFKMDHGIAHSDDFQFVSNVGEGKAKGDIDLPNWRMKVAGDIQLSQNLFAQLLSGTTGLTPTLPFRIEGDLTEPDVVLDTAKLPGKVLSIPGEILDKGVGKLLRKLVPSTGK